MPRSASRSKSRDKSRSRSRSKSQSRSRERRDRREKSRSESRERSIDDYVKRSLTTQLQSVLDPIKRQLIQVTQSQTQREGVDSSSCIEDLKAKQDALDIQTKAASLKSTGGQSQFRSVATLRLHMKNALTRLDDALLMLDSPEDPLFAALTPVRGDIEKAIAEADDRMDLITRADADPKLGWRALSIYESRQKASKLDPEKEKIFSSCLKEVQEDAKKKASSSGYKKPFRSGPGNHPGAGYGYSGEFIFKRVVMANEVKGIRVYIFN